MSSLVIPQVRPQVTPHLEAHRTVEAIGQVPHNVEAKPHKVLEVDMLVQIHLMDTIAVAEETPEVEGEAGLTLP